MFIVSSEKFAMILIHVLHDDATRELMKEKYLRFNIY